MNLLYTVWNMNPSVVPSWGMPRWYGLMWALGFYVGYIMLNRMFRAENVNEKWMDKTFIYVLVGGIVGARLGHCLFYQPDYYLSNPVEIFYIWEGGLASHGGAIGIIIAVYFLSKKITKKHMLWSLDRLVVPTIFAGFLIRMGNLFNSEIVGSVTNASWGFKFVRDHYPEGVAMELTQKSNPDAAFDAIATDPNFAHLLAEVPVRYPSQLIEAICYIFIFAFMFWLYWKTNAARIQGFLLGIFFVFVMGARFIIEFIKENQAGIDAKNLDDSVLNMGQILSLPMVLFGLYLVFRRIKTFKLGYEEIDEGGPRSDRKPKE